MAAGWLAWLRARKEGVLLGSIAAAGLAAFALAFAGHAPWSWDPRPDRVQPERITAPPEKPMIPTAGEKTGLSPLSPQILGEPARFRRVITVEPPYEMVDARRFYAGDQLIVLSGIAAPPMDAVCDNPDKTLSPCGIFARATLYAIIRGEKLTCQSQGAAPELSPPPAALVGACRMQGKDVATELVRVGFARPQGFAPRAMLEAAAEANAERRGLWRNNWSIVQRRSDVLARERLFPAEGRRDDLLEIVVLWLPAEFGADAIGIGDDGGRIAGPARHAAGGEIHARHPLHHIHHLEHGETPPVTAIEDEARASIAKVVERIHMGIRQIGHVEKIADAGTIARGVIRAENVEMRALAEGGLHRDLDEMRGIGR